MKPKQTRATLAEPDVNLLRAALFHYAALLARDAVNAHARADYAGSMHLNLHAYRARTLRELIRVD
jgi:hypothetical protein